MIGVTGAFFAALSLTMASSLVISFLVAWLAIPVLAARWLRPEDAGPRAKPAAVGRRGRSGAYDAVMRPRLLRARGSCCCSIVPLAGGRIPRLPAPGDRLHAHDGRGRLRPRLRRARRARRVTETDRLLRQVEAILRQNAGGADLLPPHRLQLGGDISEANHGRLLRPPQARRPRRPIERGMDEVAKEVEHTRPRAGDRDRPAHGRPDRRPDRHAPAGRGQALLRRPAGPPGDAGPEGRRPPSEKVDGRHRGQERHRPRRRRAGHRGRPRQGGARRRRPRRRHQAPDRRCSAAASRRRCSSGPSWSACASGSRRPSARPRATCANCRSARPTATSSRSSGWPKLTPVTGQPEITREDLRRDGRRHRPHRGRDLGSTIRDVKHVLDKPGLLPAGVTLRLGGLYEQQQVAFRGLLKVIVAAAVLVFLLLLFLYESFRVAVCHAAHHAAGDGGRVHRPVAHRTRS